MYPLASFIINSNLSSKLALGVIVYWVLNPTSSALLFHTVKEISMPISEWIKMNVVGQTCTRANLGEGSTRMN